MSAKLIAPPLINLMELFFLRTLTVNHSNWFAPYRRRGLYAMDAFLESVNNLHVLSDPEFIDPDLVFCINSLRKAIDADNDAAPPSFEFTVTFIDPRFEESCSERDIHFCRICCNGQKLKFVVGASIYESLFIDTLFSINFNSGEIVGSYASLIAWESHSDQTLNKKWTRIDYHFNSTMISE